MTLETFRFDFRFYGHCKFGINAGLIYTKRLLIVTPEGFFCENFQGLIGQKYQTFMAQQIGRTEFQGIALFFSI